MYKYLISLFVFLPLFASASFDKDLYYGMRGGVQVTELQEFLTEQSFYNGPITGNFFSLTQKAVKNFQVTNQISSTGYFGPLTRAKANSLLSQVTDETGTPISPVITAPKTNDDVVAKLMEQSTLLQQQLTKLQEQQTALNQQNQALVEQNQKLGTIQQEQIKQTEQLTQQTQSIQQVQVNTALPPPLPPIPTVILSLDKFRMPDGVYIVDDGKLPFTWSSTNADKCVGKAQDYAGGYVSSGIRDPLKWGWFGDKTISGTQIVTAQESGEFKFWIECQNSSSSKQSEHITIRIRQLFQ